MINFWAYNFFEADGYGRMCYHTVKALRNIGAAVRPSLTDVLELPVWFQHMQGIDATLDNVFLTPANNLIQTPGRMFAWTMYESTQLPDGWVNNLNNVYRVLVPAQFLVEVMRENGVTTPVEVVPGGIDADECPLLPRGKDRPFTFMCLQDPNQMATRKGFDTAYAAFHKAFGRGNKDARMIVKCRANSLRDISLDNPQITAWRDDVTNVADIYAQCDCYVFPTKGEGYGLTAREAAACGRPVITTRWGGTADNIDQWAIPIDTFKMAPSHLLGGGEWAIPDVDEVAEHMRWVYVNQDRARAIGEGAAVWLKANETYEHAARKLLTVIEGRPAYKPLVRYTALTAPGERSSTQFDKWALNEVAQ